MAPCGEPSTADGSRQPSRARRIRPLSTTIEALASSFYGPTVTGTALLARTRLPFASTTAKTWWNVTPVRKLDGEDFGGRKLAFASPLASSFPNPPCTGPEPGFESRNAV